MRSKRDCIKKSYCTYLLCSDACTCNIQIGSLVGSPVSKVVSCRIVHKRFFKQNFWSTTYRFVPFILCSFPYRLGRQVSTIGCILTVTYVMYQNQNPVKSLYFPFVLPASLLLFYLSFSLPQYYLNLFLSQSGRQVHSLSHVYFINIDRPTPLMY